MTTRYAICNPRFGIHHRRSWPLIALLLVLFLGPLIAPLFQATGMPFLVDSGTLAHDLLSRYICPTPAKSYTLFGFPTAVCARCWGATIGLWGAWLLLQHMYSATIGAVNDDPHYRVRWFVDRYVATAWALRLCLALGALLLWALEMNVWPAAPLAALVLNGANGGFWAAMLAGSIWLAGRSALTNLVDPDRS